MSEMTLAETTERFNESMKKAASRARELGNMQSRNAWNTIANQLEVMRVQGNDMIMRKGLSRAATLASIDSYAGKMKEQ